MTKLNHREFKLVGQNYSASKWQIQGLNKRGQTPEPVFLVTGCSSQTVDMDEKIGQEALTWCGQNNPGGSRGAQNL